MELLEKKQEVFEQIEELADIYGWQAMAAKSDLESKYFSTLEILFTKCLEDVETPEITVYVDCEYNPSIESFEISIPYPNSSLRIAYKGYIDLDELPKILEHVDTDTILPWKLSEYLSKKGYL